MRAQTQKKNPPPLPNHVAIKAAGAAGVDPRSVLKYLRGGSVRPLTQERVERGLREIGRADLVKTASAAEMG